MSRKQELCAAEGMELHLELQHVPRRQRRRQLEEPACSVAAHDSFRSQRWLRMVEFWQHEAAFSALCRPPLPPHLQAHSAECSGAYAARRRVEYGVEEDRADVLTWALRHVIGSDDGSSTQSDEVSWPPKAGKCTLMWNPSYKCDLARALLVRDRGPSAIAARRQPSEGGHLRRLPATLVARRREGRPADGEREGRRGKERVDRVRM